MNVNHSLILIPGSGVAPLASDSALQLPFTSVIDVITAPEKLIPLLSGAYLEHKKLR